MGGWKTWAAAIGAMGTGLGMVGAGLAADPMDLEKVYAGAMMFWGGLAMIGLGHKIEKAAR